MPPRKRLKLQDASEKQTVVTDCAAGSSQKQCNYLQNGRSSKDNRKIQNYTDVTRWTKRLIEALRHALACQRWEEASKLLYALTHEPDRTSEVIWKAGFQVLCNHPNSTLSYVKQFAKSMLSFDKVFPSEIILQSAMYFIEKHDLASAKEIFEMPTRRLGNPLNEKQKHISQIMECYKILIDFAVLKKNSEVNDDAFSSMQNNSSLAEFEIKVLAQEAVQKISKIIGEPGCWDIFVIMLVEILKYNSMLQVAEEILELYVSSNPSHPNSYIFLYDFVKSHRPEDKKKLSDLLKKISQVSPSDPRILDMPDLELFDNCMQLKALFNILDYFCWQNNPKPWKCLVNVVTSMFEKPVSIEFNLLLALWKDRRSWWTQYHFSLENIQIQSSSSAEIAVSKAIIVLIFNGSGDPFIVQVEAKLEAAEFKGFLNQLKDFKKLKNSVKLPPNWIDICNPEQRRKSSLSYSPLDKRKATDSSI